MRSRPLAVPLLLAAIASVLPAHASGEYSWALPEWRATWAAPRPADNRGFAVAASDDAVFVAGVTASHGAGAGDLFLLRYALDGSLDWARTWGGFELDQAQDIVLTPDAIVVAGAEGTDDGRTRAALLRFGYDGTLRSSHTWSKGDLLLLQSVAVRDGLTLVGGLTHPGAGERNAYAAMFLPDGRMLWERDFAVAGWDEVWDVAFAPGGAPVVAGYRPACPPSALCGPVSRSDSDAWLAVLDPWTGYQLRSVTWGDAGNDEARAIALDGDAAFVTGGLQAGRSTDVFLSRVALSPLEVDWTRTTGGEVVGGGGYGVSVGDRGVYVAGGVYDFPAGGDAALLRFSRDGAVEWRQVYGLPGFWDWNFDVAVRDGRFYVAGVLWQPGLGWYRVLTLAYDEWFPTATLSGVADMIVGGEDERAAAAMEHFWLGDFQRWAQDGGMAVSPDASLTWEGASNNGRAYGRVDAAVRGGQPSAGHENADGAMLGLAGDFQSGNYALVRDYTGISGSLLGGYVRFRYFISHDRLIPQGGYVTVGDLSIPLPPPPV